MPVIPVLRRRKQESQVFEVSLCYLREFETSLGYVGPYLRKLKMQPEAVFLIRELVFVCYCIGFNYS